MHLVFFFFLWQKYLKSSTSKFWEPWSLQTLWRGRQWTSIKIIQTVSSESWQKKILLCLKKEFFASQVEAQAGTEKTDTQIEYPLHLIAASLEIQARKEIRQSFDTDELGNMQWNASTHRTPSAQVLFKIYSDKSHTTFNSFVFTL